MTEEEFLELVHDNIKILTAGGELGLTGYMWALDQNDGVCVYALDLSPQECWQMFLVESLEKKPKMICMVIDRYSKEGQGTTLDSLVTGKFCNYQKSPAQGSKTFIVEYQEQTEHIVLDMCFDNEHWNKIIQGEFAKTFAAMTVSRGDTSNN